VYVLSADSFKPKQHSVSRLATGFIVHLGDPLIQVKRKLMQVKRKLQFRHGVNKLFLNPEQTLGTQSMGRDGRIPEAKISVAPI